MRKKGSRVHSDLYLDPEKHEQLVRLSQLTRVPMAAYAREALDDLLSKYADVLRTRRDRSRANSAQRIASPRTLTAARHHRAVQEKA
jgi:hypothetical protein